MNYEVSLDIRPKGTVPEWNNIIHVTSANENIDRIPAVWFHPSSTKLHIRTHPCSNSGYDPPNDPLPLNQWTSLTIRCATPDGCDILINDNRVGFSPWEPSGRTAVKAIVYLSSPWSAPANADVRNIKIISLDDSPPPLTLLSVPQLSTLQR